MVNFVKNMINKDKKVNMSLSCKTVYNKYENKTKDIEFFKEIFPHYYSLKQCTHKKLV